MEPMTLGSPGGSPSANPNYLPSFLMGEPQTQLNTPRSNTLSPNKATNARNLNLSSYANSPAPSSQQDYNRSVLGQKTLFGGYQQQSPEMSCNNYSGAPLPNHNTSVSGPPTQGLFDSLRQERNQVQTPTRSVLPSGVHANQQSFGTPLGMNNMSQCYQQQQQHQQQNSLHQQALQSTFNESYLNNASFNASARCVVSPLGPGTPGNNTGCLPMHAAHMLPSASSSMTPRYTEFWITIYGFPPSASATILQHFAQCGTIVDKVFPPQNGNWVHLKYASRLECDKALNYNEKVLNNNIMIGVTHCKDRNIIDKENLCENVNVCTPKVRPLAQTAYKNAQCDLAVVPCPAVPQKSSGLMNKAMDLFFGW